MPTTGTCLDHPRSWLIITPFFRTVNQFDPMSAADKTLGRATAFWYKYRSSNPFNRLIGKDISRMTDRPPLMILGLHYSSLHVARSLREKGVPVFGIDRQKDVIAAGSRYIKRIKTPLEGEELKDFLLSFSDRSGGRAVCIPLTDFHLQFFLEYHDSLAGRLLFPMSNPGTISNLLGKRQLAATLASLDINHPKTLFLEKGGITPAALDGIGCPCIFKPNYKMSWENHPEVEKFIGEGQLVSIVDDMQTLVHGVDLLSPLADLIIQEYIPGPSENHYYYAGYRDRNGRIVTSFLGNKIRTLPDCMGPETLLESIHKPELLAYGDEVLHRLDYRGPAGIDFKFDSRDGKYKVIEINCRIGINDCYLARFGLDLPYFYYLDSQGINIEPRREYPAGITWYDPFRDFSWMRLYGKEKGMSWGSWIRQLRGHDIYAIIDCSDPIPGLRLLFGIFFKTLARKINPFRRAVGGRKEGS